MSKVDRCVSVLFLEKVIKYQVVMINMEMEVVAF